MSEFSNYKDERRTRWEARVEHHRGNGHVWTGVFLLIIGGLALVKSFGVPFPKWLFSWQMLLIAIGLFIGFRRGFRDGGWFVPIIVGGAFLVNDYVLLGELRKHIWPLVLVVLGAFFVFRPRKSRFAACNEKKNTDMNADTTTPIIEANYSQDDFLDLTAIFGGSKKVVLSKNFKGGDIVNVFGGSEIDLTQADTNGSAELEVTAIFGGATLVVPGNWAVKSEAVTIFGGISDKRKIPVLTEPTQKTLVIKGTVIFGGIEIKSY